MRRELHLPWIEPCQEVTPNSRPAAIKSIQSILSRIKCRLQQLDNLTIQGQRPGEGRGSSEYTARQVRARMR